MQIRFPKGILLIALAGLLMGMLAFGIYKQIYRGIVGEIYDEAMTYSNIHYIPGYTAGPSITAGSAILIDGETGTVLYAKNEHMRRPPASTTKIMTALVALERGDLASIVTVSQRASRVEGSSLWLKPGQKLSLEELVEGTMLKSGNDGATAIAEHIAGTESAFVKLMNRKARQIGALNTQFKNPHGLPAAGHYSTAFDLALTARYALRHHKFADIVKKKVTTLEFEAQEWTPQFHNTNKLLWSLEGADGVKTGTTSEAGYCLVSSATRDGRQLIAVVLRSGARWQDSAKLLEYGFGNFQLLRLYSRGQEVDRITITGGMEDSLILVAGSDLKVVVPAREVELLTTEFVPKRDASAPYRKYEMVGELKVTLKGEEIGSLPLLAATSIPRRTFLALSSRWIRNNIERFFGSIKRIFG